MSGITFSGLASGLDTGSIIDQLVALERIPINNLQSQKSDLQTQSNKIQSISSKIKALETAAEELADANNVALIDASSSDDEILGVSVTGRAPSGSYSIEVTALAHRDRNYSANLGSGALGFADTDTLTFEIDGEVTTIDLDATDTLENVASKINSAGGAAWATVIGDGSGGGALLISSEETGADQAITFGGTGAALLSMTNEQAASDASFIVDGVVTATSSDNSVEDIIPGVSLELVEVGTAEVTVEADAESFKALVQTFVDSYNAVISEVNREFAWTGEARSSGNLSGDSTLRNVQRTLQSGVIDQISGLSGAFNSMASIGITSDSTGTLSIDEAALDEAIAQDADAVKDVFIHNTDTGTQGVAYRLITPLGGAALSTLEGLIDSEVGALSVRIDGIDERMENIDDTIERQEVRVEAYEARLRQQFLAMEQAMSALEGQSAYLTGLSGGTGS